MDESTDGKITLAVISSQIADLRILVGLTNIKLDDVKSCQDKMYHIPADVEALKKTVGDQGDALIAVKTEVRIIGGINGILAGIAGIVGSIFGTRSNV